MSFRDILLIVIITSGSLCSAVLYYYVSIFLGVIVDRGFFTLWRFSVIELNDCASFELDEVFLLALLAFLLTVRGRLN